MLQPINFGKLYEDLLPELTEAFQSFIRKGIYIDGPFVDEFEDAVKDFLGAKYVVACKNATYAMEMSLKYIGVRRGDEVITVGNTYYATARAIKDVGAKPVFCEIDPKTGQIDPKQVERLITPRTKAILPVHLYGIPADLDALREIANRRNLHIVEDCSHSFGSKYRGRFIGADSEFACFSLYPTKTFGAFGDGGIVATNSASVAARVKELRYLSNAKRDSFDAEALHARFDALQGALTKVVLKNFEILANKRRKLIVIYKNRLDKYVKFFDEDSRDDVLYYVLPCQVEKREELIRYMKENNVVIQVHYDHNLHLMPEFSSERIKLPITEYHNKHVISLSVNPSLEINEVEMICDLIEKFYLNL